MGDSREVARSSNIAAPDRAGHNNSFSLQLLPRSKAKGIATHKLKQ
jgi:hypothetical protein